MADVSYSKLLENCKLMASGIGTFQATLTAINIAAADATALSAQIAELEALNIQQEVLKANLKAKTSELNAKLAETKANYANLSKRVKLVVPKEQWSAFGITAKH